MKTDSSRIPSDQDTQKPSLVTNEKVRHVAALIVAILALLLATPDVWNDFRL